MIISNPMVSNAMVLKPEQFAKRQGALQGMPCRRKTGAMVHDVTNNQEAGQLPGTRPPGSDV
jgi:hypothetical protein